MSEFTCKNGHIMKSGLKCHICGDRLARMDGLSASELRRKEAWEDRMEGEERSEDPDE